MAKAAFLKGAKSKDTMGPFLQLHFCFTELFLSLVPNPYNKKGHRGVIKNTTFTIYDIELVTQ